MNTKTNIKNIFYIFIYYIFSQIQINQNQCSRLCLFGFDNLLCASLCWSN